MASPLEGERVASLSNRAAIVGGVLAGLVLLAHPAYLETLSVYPGTGWWFFPMFHAAFTALGVVLVGVAVLRWHYTNVPVTALGGLALVAVLTAAAYAWPLLALTGAEPAVLEGTAIKRLVVGAVVAGLFLLGLGLGAWRWRPAAVGLAVPIVPLGALVLEWRSSEAVLGPVVDGFILLTNPGILGIEYLGSYLLLAALLAGLLAGLLERTGHHPA